MKINIAKDFSRYPAGRYYDDGEYSGQAFRDEHLLPAIKQGQKFIVQLDGTKGYGSSFLEEAFGGLIRCGVTVEQATDLIVFETKDDTLKIEIEEYIREGGKGLIND